MKNVLLLTALFFSCFYISAQSREWAWAKTPHQPNNYTTSSGSVASATDAQGNLVVTGYFWTDSITFGSYTLYNTMPDGSGNDVFVVKYDLSGNVLWATKFGGTSYDYPNAIATDRSGNTYVTGGFYSDSIRAGAGSIYNHDLTDTTGDVFIFKINPAGTIIWSTCIGGDNVDEGWGIATDTAGNVYTAIVYSSDSLTAGADEYYNATTTQYRNSLLIKCDSTGAVLWGSSSYDPDGGMAPVGLQADPAGNTFMVGWFNGTTVSFDGLSATNYRVDWSDAFIVKYDPAGHALWVQSGGGALSEQANAVALDAQGNSYVTGYYNSPTALFGPYTLNNDTTDGSGDIFLAKYDPSGNLLWINSYGSDMDDVGDALATDTAGHIYMTGYYYSARIGFGPDTLVNTDNTGNTDDLFVTGFDSDGSIISTTTTGGLSYDFGTGLSTDLAGDLYVAGVFRSDDIVFGSTTLDNGTANHNNTPFIAKYVAVPAGLHNIPQLSDLSVYPNPAGDMLMVRSSSLLSAGEDVSATVYDVTGSAITVNYMVSDGEIKMNTGALAPGIYVLDIIADAKESRAKFVKTSIDK